MSTPPLYPVGKVLDFLTARSALGPLFVRAKTIVVISVMTVIGFADGWSDIVQFAKD
jgi:hypothetical protein